MTVIQMIKSDVEEALHILNVLNKYSVTCSLELKLAGTTDNLVAISSQPVKVDYIENLNDEGDALVIELGESEFCFPLNLSVSKDITDIQVFLYIGNEKYDVWLDSGSLAPEVISEITNYKSSDLDTIEDPFMEVNEHERKLIEHIRKMDFDDMLDVTGVIDKESDNAATKSILAAHKGRTHVVKGFAERSETLKELAVLMGLANEDYRNHVYPEDEGDE
ncbi:hypothetical protein [Paenibacillus massiliensis]|uniref:hypothetical protein n=1 Tax=Paenibacillus massiliensis TaxID=225917 RepID=UPI000470FCF2|nr:hypothetical protein [Paenibacillus massiliensis]